jgi:hypothetical protein
LPRQGRSSKRNLRDGLLSRNLRIYLKYGCGCVHSG